MTRTLTRAGICAIALLLLAPVLASAAADDVTLTTDTILSVNGVTLNVSGSSATIESIVVDSGTFSITILSGSVFEVTAPNRNELNPSTLSDATVNTCSSSESRLRYEATATRTISITPLGSLCTTASGGGSTPAPSGGGGSSVATQTIATTATTTADTTTTATETVTSETTTSDGAALQAQLGALQNQLAGLQGASTAFTRNLEVGGTGDDVLALQKFLNANGFTIAESGPGSSGNETSTFGGLTRAALAKFQAANGITPSVGYFGPKTRAAINATAGGSATIPATPSAPAAPSSTAFTRDLEVGGTGDDVLALQQFLNANGFQVSDSGPGSPGNETSTFGGLTRAALAKFQAANGITPSVGYFGPKTRVFIQGM